MRRLMSLVLVAVATALSGQPQGPVLPNQGLEILQRYGGIAKFSPADVQEGRELAPLLITDQEGFEKFLAVLPPADSSRPGAPVANPDPLLRGPRFDWTRTMLLVVFDGQSLSFPPNVSRVELGQDGLVAVVEYPDTKGLIEAKPPELGSYGAALVVRSDRSLTWSNPGHKAQEAQRQSMMLFLPKSEP